MSGTTTTGAGSNGSEADKADTATGGDANTETDNGSKKLEELESTLNGWAQKTRKLDKTLKDLGSKLDSVLSRFTSDDGDDDDGDDEGEEGTEGEGSGTNQDTKPKGGKDAGNAKNPEVRKLLKKLERERKDAETKLRDASSLAEAWKSRFEQTERRRILNEELAKHKVLPAARHHVIKLVEGEIEVNVDEDGSVEASHKDYPSVAKFLEEFLNENPVFLENARASGTGDGGGSDRGAGSGGGVKLPNGFQGWDLTRQREWVKGLTPEQRREVIKKIGW